jgi:multimeric flavodoxin WrbA
MSDPSASVVGIYGSPRKGGNSDTLLDAALSGAEAAGAATQRIYLRDLDFVPCQNCGFCSTKGVCRIQDDMGGVYEALDSSDVILLAAPIYFCSISAQAKAMIDRCQPYWAKKYVLKEEPPKEGRRGGFISCCGFKDDRFRVCTEQIAQTWFYIMGVEYGGCCFKTGLDARHDAANDSAATKDAAEFGGGLVQGNE